MTTTWQTPVGNGVTTAVADPSTLPRAEGTLGRISLRDVPPQGREPFVEGPIGCAALPPVTFVSTEPWREQRIGAAAVYCSDGRWGDAVDELCHRCLGIPAYDRFAVPGGPGWLNERAPGLGTLAWTARDQLEFLVSAHKLERIILITHWGCAFYAHRMAGPGGNLPGPETTVDAQLADVRTARMTLRRWFGPIGVEGYLAMRTGTTLSFHRLLD
jgi:hypothetical protein